MNTTKRSVCLRAVFLAVAATGAVTGVSAILLPTVDLTPRQPFATLLSQWCSVVLLGCALWAWLVTAFVLVEAVHTPRGTALPAQRRGIPSRYRRLVLGACGLALAAGTTAPALATPGPIHLDTHTVATRPVGTATTPATTPRPSTPTTPPAAAPARAPMNVPPQQQPHPQAGDDIVVRSGDSLWHLAAERLPRDADDAIIVHTWRRLYETNHRLIGDDPDHIEPGQRLTRPEGW